PPAAPAPEVKPAPKRPAADRLRAGEDALKRGDFEEAVKAFSAALERDPGNAPAHLQRARALLRRHDYPAALADCAAVLRLDPRLTSQALLCQAEVQAHCDRVEEVRDACTRVLQLDDRLAAAHALLGWAMVHQPVVGRPDFERTVVTCERA